MKCSLGISNFLEEIPAAAAAAAKLLQSCPTLWDPIDGSPPGSPVPGILQARTLEWVAISFSNAWTMNFQMFNLVLEKAEEPEIKLPIHWIMEKAREFQKNIYFCALIAEEGFLISCYSLELCIQMLISFLFSFAFCFSSFLWRKLSTEELMLLNCGIGEDSWESLGLQGDPTSPSWRRSALGFLWKEWC